MVHALLIALAVTPQAAVEMPTEKEVRASIQRMMKTPKRATNVDLSTVVRFADKSSRVQVDLIKGLLPVEDGMPGQVLLAYHIAGAVQFDLDNPAKAKHPEADKAAAVRATLVGYKMLQEAKGGYRVELLEKLTRLDREGRLPAHIKSILASQKRK